MACLPATSQVCAWKVNLPIVKFKVKNIIGILYVGFFTIFKFLSKLLRVSTYLQYYNLKMFKYIEVK